MLKSLGALLALGLAGLQFLAVLAVVFSSYLTSQTALLNHARDLLRDVGINTMEHSKGFLSPAEGAAELAARLAQNRVVASDDPRRLEQLLFQQLQIAPQFAGVYYGAANGDFVYVMRSPDQPGVFRSKIIERTHTGARQTRLIWRNGDFSVRKATLDPEDRFDPRTRPWYIKASEQGSTIWTDPYIFFSSQQPGITLAAPVFRNDRAVRGVVGVDIEISMISEFLSRLNIGTHGKALIIHRNGDVIAHPNQELIKTKTADGALRFADIREIEDPIARAAFGPAAERGAIPATKETPLQFIHDGERYVSTMMPVISDKLPWTIAVYAPENDFTEVIKRNRTMNIWLAALVAAVTAAVGLGLAVYIHKPVRAFAVRTALVSQGEIDPDEPMPKTYRELERANAALVQEIFARRAAEREYGETFNMSSRGMAQIAAGCGRITRVNKRFADIVGREVETLIGMPFGDLIHPDDAQNFVAPDRSEDGEFVLNRDLRCIGGNGQTIWVIVNAITIRDRQGQVLHAVLTMDDVTQSRSREQEIERLNKDLSHLARGNTMGQMASGLAHELNQPLAVIAQNADTALLMLDRKGDDGELHDIIAEIEQQSLRAGDIIRALRSFIRKDEGIRTAFNFPELLDQALRLMQAEATEAGVSIETRLPDDLPQVEGNRVQIAQVLVNLLRNAIEAIASQSGNQREIAIGATVAAGFVTVSVDDTGPGIAPDLSLFSQFETTKANGMGLGLSICRSIVEANGGALWLDEKAENGTRFCFTIPLHQSQAM
ncbi:cache domain-containing protein [Paracoccus mangrovi]|uniref:histidine kinase n=1 Tax=Paracoccus mangrovi TaxID=1715645 RepID=A0ABV7R314_9RHOB